jgi:hypothetical protein
VKIVHFPCEFSTHEYTLHDETRAVYCHLIETAEVLPVSEIDSDGYPWVSFEMQSEDGATEYHALMLNNDGLVLVDDASA